MRGTEHTRPHRCAHLPWLPCVPVQQRCHCQCSILPGLVPRLGTYACAGRVDAAAPDPESRLPLETFSADELLASFAAKGLSAQEMVVLSGSHVLGAKGFGDDPLKFDNVYYKVLLRKPWVSGDSMAQMIGLHVGTGLRTFAPDRRMKFGFEPLAPGFFWCAGQGGMGIQTAPAASLLCATLIRAEEMPSALNGIDPADFAPRVTA